MEKVLIDRAEDLLRRSDNAEKITIEELEDFLNFIPRFAEKHTVEETDAFLEYLGDPEENMKIIHVAGTNGKGSVCSYMSSILMRAGYTVGTFTSPHLVKINERFCIDTKPVSDGVFLVVFIETLRRIYEYKEWEYFPTYFEFLFFMAILLYDVYPVDYLVLETGLGGRLDATNSVKKPVISIISEIGFDHMQYLGDTIAKIAAEKAGIIKKGVPVVFFDKSKESSDVIKKTALDLDTRAIAVESKNITDVLINKDEQGNKYIAFSYNSLYDKYVGLRLSTIAKYQTENAALAITACEILRDQGAEISELDISEGLISARWSGRMEEIRPGIFVDGAHNIDGIDAFIESVRDYECEGRKLLLFGIVGDKQYRDIVDRLLSCRIFDSVFVAVLSTERTVSVGDLKTAFEDAAEKRGIIGLPIKYYSNVRDAVTDIITIRKSRDTVFAAGSLYLAGQIKGII
jgi:dihydrofolate synthase/folylpolyglutamate synthase